MEIAEDSALAQGSAADTTSPDAPGHHRYQAERQALLNRLRRIEGQVRGIQRMVAEDRYCVDVLQQTAAITAGLQEVSLIVLRGHVEGCVAEAIRSGEEEELIEELMHAIRNGVGRWVAAPHGGPGAAASAELERVEE